MSRWTAAIGLALPVLFFVPAAQGIDVTVSDPPAVFIDCDYCDLDFIKTEITFVNYVIDRAVAEVHVLITTQTTGSGGTAYTITFIGQQAFSGMTDTLGFVTSKGDADDTIRRGLVKALKLGLVRYAAQTSAAGKIVISSLKTPTAAPLLDRWKSWVFSISGNGFFNGQQSTGSRWLSGSVSANRTTDEWKIRLRVYNSYSSNFFVINDSTINPPATVSYGATGNVVNSLGDHFSVGGSAGYLSSTYTNLLGQNDIGPAVEFDVFPYHQSTRRMLTVQYRVGYRYNRYYETTIYDKSFEHLANQSLAVTLEQTEPWGSVSTTVEGANYLHDFSKYRLSLNPGLSLRLIKGLSLNINGYAARIRDQLSLSKKGLTSEEILLRIKQLKTQYEYYGSVGLTYSFGSLYSNVVNPRM